MARKLKSIFEIFNEYSENEILQVINNLTDEEKEIIKDRYGDNLHIQRLLKIGLLRKIPNFIAVYYLKLKKLYYLNIQKILKLWI